MTVLMESFMAYGVGMAYYTYHMRLSGINEITPRLLVPETAKISAFIFIGVCMLKLVTAVSNFSHAGTRTNRTVENVNGQRSFLQKVTIVSTLASLAILYCLNSHKVLMPEAQSAAESLEQSVYFQIALQLVSHYLMNSLHDQEAKLPRIVDLRAHSTKL